MAYQADQDIILDVLDVGRRGGSSRSAVAFAAGHLDPRERDRSDRRAVVVRALRARNAELMRLYSGMNTSMDQICAVFGDTELELLGDFLRRTANAGRSASDELDSD